MLNLKKIKGLLFSLIALSTSLSLLSCSGNHEGTLTGGEPTSSPSVSTIVPTTVPTTAPTTAPSTAPTTVPTTVPTTPVVDQNKIYDEITKTCKLTRDYEGKDFFTDGIELATLSKATDGDTAQFQLNSGKSVVIRFFCIDTPESTGAVEKWGKSASKFTANILDNATQIVLEGSTTPPSVDSYGSRYLGYIWYKTAEYDDWMNLNLQIVENGYSESKSLPTASYPYDSYFTEAQAFAKNAPLHIWNKNIEDPYYSTDAVVATIKEINDNINEYYNYEEQTGAKVRIENVYLKSITVSNSGTHTFVASQYVNGVENTINIYTGYSSASASKNMKVGSSYTITGTVQDYYGNIQISGVTFVSGASGGDYVTLIEKEAYKIFDSSLEFNSYYGKTTYSCLCTDATVTEAVIEGSNIKLTVSAQRVLVTGIQEAEEFVFVINNTKYLTDVSNYVGKTVKAKGLFNSETKTVNVIEYEIK